MTRAAFRRRVGHSCACRRRRSEACDAMRRSVAGVLARQSDARLAESVYHAAETVTGTEQATRMSGVVGRTPRTTSRMPIVNDPSP
jgi:hypothetical protein